MKKKLLFVIDSLGIAGAEKSLVTLLNLLDFSKYEVDLQLFAHGYMLEELVPKEVNILKPLNYTKYAALNLQKAFLHSLLKMEYNMFSSRMRYSFHLRKKNSSNPEKARLYWQNISNVIEDNPKEYDVAISYAQGVPTFFVATKVNARRKLSWVNVSYRLNSKEKDFQKNYYDHFDKIIAVSDSTKKVFLETFPEYHRKVSIQYDINNPDFIAEMAVAGKGYSDNFDGIRILTIGRLANQKGYDTAIEACKILKEEGIQFKWYVLGKGPLQDEIKKSIKELDLIKHFILLGVEANPYPYIKNANIYVQTSRYEGFGLAIAEARMLNTPVVTTKFDAVYNQMVDGKNGLVVDRNVNAVVQGIKRIIYDDQVRKSIIEYLVQEKKGNIDEVKNFYNLIESS